MVQKIDVTEALAGLPLWREAPGDRPAIERKLAFEDFNAAFGFMTTHDAGGVTERDLDMARFIDEAALALGGR